MLKQELDGNIMTRSRSLDVLRGVAILLVIGFHLNVWGVFKVGWIGVDLFFVLSGFLISGLLFRDYEKLGTIHLGHFWFRRAFKILPPLYTYLAASALAMATVHCFPGRVYWSTALFYSNYLPRLDSAGALVVHIWSLAIEEHFYLLCPVLLSFLVRFRRSPFAVLPAIGLALAVVCFTLRVKDPGHYTYTHSRVDALFAGVTLRYFERFRPAWFRKLGTPVVLLLGLTFWIPAYLTYDSNAMLRSADTTWALVAAAALVGWCFCNDSAAWWNHSLFRTLASVGFYSYSIYLWQQPVTMFFRGMAPAVFFTTCGFVFSVAAGVGAAKLIEIPALRLRERIQAGRSGSLDRRSLRVPELAIMRASCGPNQQ